MIVTLTYRALGQISGRMFGFAIAAALLAGVIPTVAAAKMEFASKQDAFAQGMSAYKGHKYGVAVPALTFAAKHGVLRAKLILAKIYSDNSGGWTDHARAYGLLRDIVSGHSNVDPNDFRTAPVVAQALTSIARYERDGIKSLNMKPNTKRALMFFDHAATYFGDEDAQFELAKHYLAGDGVRAQVPYALNWLAGLSKRGHAGAQAFLANLYWDGRYTLRDPVRALALITVAVENAKEEDRFWIEDVHQNIFCEASAETRRRVYGVVDGWRQRFGRAQTVSSFTVPDRDSLDDLTGGTKRLCANGDVVGELIPQPPRRGEVNAFSSSADGGPSLPRGLPMATPKTEPRRIIRTNEPLKRLEPIRPPAAGPIKMTRIKPDRSDKRALNGFALRPASDIGEETKPSDSHKGPLKYAKPDRSQLNGFVLQGNSATFGFSSSSRTGQ